ncbi:MAG: hypothetical protein E5W28_10190, partial [Mesorhizobium sp.]
VQAASNVAFGAATGATAAAANSSPQAGNALGYYVDSLFRPTDAGTVANPNGEDNGAAVGQATRILTVSAVNGQVSADDKAYLARLVAARTGLSQADATKRVDAVLGNIEDAKNKAKAAADESRRASATSALIGALALVIGAFIASAAAALGGR